MSISDNSRRIILYSPDNDDTPQAIVFKVCRAVGRTDLQIHRTIYDFIECISELAVESPLLILSIVCEEEMNCFISQSSLLDRFDLVIKLSSGDPKLVNMASRLRPRLTISDWSDPERIGLLLEGLLGKHNPKTQIEPPAQRTVGAIVKARYYAEKI